MKTKCQKVLSKVVCRLVSFLDTWVRGSSIWFRVYFRGEKIQRFDFQLVILCKWISPNTLHHHWHALRPNRTHATPLMFCIFWLVSLFPLVRKFPMRSSKDSKVDVQEASLKNHKDDRNPHQNQIKPYPTSFWPWSGKISTEKPIFIRSRKKLISTSAGHQRARWVISTLEWCNFDWFSWRDLMI